MRPGLFKPAMMVLLATLLAACGTLPTGSERLALVEQLVDEQEFARAENLLADIDARDPEFEALLVRRRAIRPLIQQFEENTLDRVIRLKATDDWPGAEAELEAALQKLPDSEVLRAAEEQFYEDRITRLEDIDREISLLRGEHLAAKTPLVRQAKGVHPGSIKARWQAFRHGREAEGLADELLSCGEQALAESRYDLAESCLRMAASLTQNESTSAQLAQLERRREQEQARAAAEAEAQREAEEAARLARDTEQVNQLKARYQRLVDAGWWVAAKEILTELRAQVPQDSAVLSWSEDLQAIVNEQVAAGIQKGQALYSEGQLHDALAVWRDAARLEPSNPVLQAHIARVERFIAKLQRLDKDDDA